MAKKILIVDDYPQLVEALKLRLEATGYQVITAADGQEGLSLARRESPDLIILDVMLPKMNGYKVCRFLKFDAKYKNIPIIMLTSRGGANDMQMGKATGANAYVVKPYDPKVLMSLVQRFLGESPRGTAKPSPAPAQKMNAQKQ
jgi:DNA-binding response OmpR family regulator